MRVLVACERSGVVRNAFLEAGHIAYSCDLEPSDYESFGYHLQGDAIEAAYSLGPWDMLVAHPECTYLSNSSAKHLYAGMKKANGPAPERWARMGAAAQFFMTLWNAPVPRAVIENPIMLGHPKELFGIPEQTQIIQPWMFGDFETKGTCLWLRGLDPLLPTFRTWQDCRDALGLPTDAKPKDRMFKMGPGPNRKRERSRTYAGIAEAMATQWGCDKSGVLNELDLGIVTSQRIAA